MKDDDEHICEGALCTQELVVNAIAQVGGASSSSTKRGANDDTETVENKKKKRLSQNMNAFAAKASGRQGHFKHSMHGNVRQCDTSRPCKKGGAQKARGVFTPLEWMMSAQASTK